MRIRFHAVVGAMALTMIASLLTACGDSGRSITLYNAQHRELMEVLADGFTEETGIKVKFRQGSDFELGNQIIQEGDASPADVFVTENSPSMTLVDSHNLFSPIEPATLAQLPARYAPSDGDWTGFAAALHGSCLQLKAITAVAIAGVAA